METIESFIQYALCDLCRVHHNVGKKHVYSKKHQDIVKNVLAKYLKKINEAKQYLKNPEVHDLLWEDGAKVWCYFCAQEIEKHSRNADTALSIRSHNFLLHLATPAHEAACKSFFWKNKVSKSAVPQYVIKSTLIAKAEPVIAAAEKAYLEKMDRLHQQTVAVIQNMDRQRTDLVTKARIEASTSKGNIHTGARPPWLDDGDDSEDEDDGEATPAKRPCIGQISKVPIGPTMADFQKHLLLEKRKKLNPDRVGANFDHFSETSEQWLPSFGRVWNFGRRWQSRNQYRMEEQATKRRKSTKDT